MIDQRPLLLPVSRLNATSGIPFIHKASPPNPAHSAQLVDGLYTRAWKVVVQVDGIFE